MHLLVRERASLDEAAAAEDIGQPPADVVFLSFSDADLAALSSAAVPTGFRVATVALARLAHPMSVDVFIDRTVPGSGVVVVRLLGGIDYWRYGAEELAAACRRASVPLAIVAGDSRRDDRLASLSTVDAPTLARLDAMLREGGAANASRAIRLALAIGGRLDDDGDQALSLPAYGIQDLGVDCPAGAVGRVAIVLYRSHALAHDLSPHRALACALVARGLEARAWFVDSLKSPGAAAFLTRALLDFAPNVVMNATCFSARDAAGVSPLEAAGVPVLQLVLAGTDRAAWAASSRGLSPQDLAMQAVLPELDGRLLTSAIGCKAEQDGVRRSEPLEEGVALAADRAAGWIRLALTPPGERRIAIVLSDYPGADGATHAVGHAVGLDSLASLADMLGRLADAGYDVGGTLPSAEALTGALLTSKRRVVTLGKLVVAVQPDRTGWGDRKAAYHDQDAAPCRAYVAFHRWLRRRHAVIHLGTHGTLEWLPGKAAALSASCWPAALLRGTPVIYPFIVNNPGEASVAKRRLGAVTIGHLTPPLVAAGLSGEARAVERLIDEFASCDGLDRRRAAMLHAEIIERGAASGLLAEAGGGGEDALAKLDAYLCDIKELRIADGLHVFGRAPAGREALLAAVGVGHEAALDASAPGEWAALLAALDGRFVEPGPAGAPSRGRADVLPTGRNLTSIDPRAIPTPSAVRLAARNADALLTRHLQETGEDLRRLVLDLWGSASLRTGGEDFALALVLMGVAPLHDDGSSRMTGIEILPLAVLDRPRVDVTLRISGVFRDSFADQVALFDQAVRMLASRDEADDDNPLAQAARGLDDAARRRATWRVFGPEPGRFGTGRSGWLAGSGYAYGAQTEGVKAVNALASLAARAEAFAHQQDHRETDILDGPEHAAHEGGFASAARALGASPVLYHFDIAETPRVRLVREEVARVVRGRLANPVWLAGMRRHGYRGASEMARGVEALADFARALPDRFDAQFDLVAAALLADAAVSAFVSDANPVALASIKRTLSEMLTNGLWRPRRNDIGEWFG